MDGKISGIVVNYKTKELTLAAVDSLLREALVSEVVVVDNASGDGSVEFLRSSWPSHKVRIVVSGANTGFGSGVNLAAVETTGSLLLVLNSDAILEPGSLVPLVSALRSDDRVAIAAPMVVNGEGEAQVDAQGDFPSVRTMLLRTNRRPPDRLHPDWVSGVAMLVRREAFEAVGGFDPAFHMYLEDVDICRRLRGRGWDVIRVPQSRVVHRLGESSRSSEREEQYHRSFKLLLAKQGASRVEIEILSAARKVWGSFRSSQRMLNDSL